MRLGLVGASGDLAALARALRTAVRLSDRVVYLASDPGFDDVLAGFQPIDDLDKPIAEESGPTFQDLIAGEEEEVEQEVSVNLAQEALRDAIVGRMNFVGVLSHELRGPLAPIGNALHVLDRAAPGSEHALRARAIISRQFDRLARLVDDLLDATCVTTGKLQVQRTRVDLAEVVRRAVADHRSLFVRCGVGLELRVADAPLWVDGDAVRLSQVVGSLLANAAKPVISDCPAPR